MRSTKRSRHLPAKAYDRIPRATLTLTDETVWLTRHDPRGRPAATYPVTSSHVAEAFNLFGASTGLLPADTLFWQSAGNRTRVGVWLPAGKRRLVFDAGKRRVTLNVPLPGLVFVGEGAAYSIFAAKRRPVESNERLYKAPLPNVGEGGRICAGNVHFPKAGPGTLGQAVNLFFESEFNHDLGQFKLRTAYDSLLQALTQLQSQRVFPLDELVDAGVTVGQVMTGEE